MLKKHFAWHRQSSRQKMLFYWILFGDNLFCLTCMAEEKLASLSAKNTADIKLP